MPQIPELLLGGLATACAVALFQRNSKFHPHQKDMSAELWYILEEAKVAANGGPIQLEHVLSVQNGRSRGARSAAPVPNGQAAADGPDALTKKDLEDTMKQMLFNQAPDNGDMSALERFCMDLTAEARRSKLDPVIGRDNEIRRVVQILSRRTKNNPVLIGESGVGKTAIVHALAQRIVAGDVPVSLLGTSIMELDVGALTAGCMMPGEFEERLKAVLTEVANTHGRTILFIDDIHNLVPNAAAQTANQVDGSSILKPALSRGQLRCIGASTLDKYKKTVERDPALERRLQQVMVEQPTVEDTVSILRGLRSRYEGFHGVNITEAALIAAAQLSHRFISTRFLPDKAIDLIDEATAQVKMNASLKPELLDSADRRLKQLQTERTGLQDKAKNDRTAAACLVQVEEAIAEAKAVTEAMREDIAAKQNEGQPLPSAEAADLPKLAMRVGQLHWELSESERAGDIEHMAEIEEELNELQPQLMAAQFASRPKPKQAEVVEGDIAQVISKWTGIPVAKLLADDKEKLLHLAEELHKRIIGQAEAVDAVAEAIQRARADLADPNGPIASFMFLGPTGVGKTELAKALAASLFNSEDALVRLDMSEYMEKHSVSRLIGAPPGYVGYEEGGLLTEAVRRRPYAVVLFDEIEKAHVDVFNILLQILDDGRVTDTQGRTINFKNSLIIMTSNLGSGEIFEEIRSNRAAVKDKVMEHVRHHFRPEFINRVDDFITFDPLQPDEIKQIVRLRAQRLVDRMAEKRMTLELQESAVEHLADKGYDPVYGARPVKRALQRELQTLLAQKLLHGELEEDDVVQVVCKADRLVLVRMPAPKHANGDVSSNGDVPSTPAPGLNPHAPVYMNGSHGVVLGDYPAPEDANGDVESVSEGTVEALLGTI